MVIINFVYDAFETLNLCCACIIFISFSQRNVQIKLTNYSYAVR